MEFCQGGEMFMHVREFRKLDEAAVRFYAAEILLAVQYLHEKFSAIHR